MERDEVEVHILAKTERGQYPAILTEKTWSIKDILVYLNGNNAAEGENNIKYANSYPMNLTVKN